MRSRGPGPVKKKIFKPKCDLPKLTNYRTGANERFWKKFPRAEVKRGKSLVCPEKLRKLAGAWGCSDKKRLETVCADLETGADIGCRGSARVATVSGNATSSYKFGHQVTDEIACWVEKGFVSGPVEEAEVPAQAKINSILCREKPNGAVRVILNLSAPDSLSVNDGIDSDNFPAVMSSTEKWLAVLNMAGRNCDMVKIDWAAAYKHIAVREEDMNLQWFKWLEKFFVEKCLVFGGASSAGIYDRLAKTVLDIVLRKSRFPRNMVCQHLDDVCAAAAEGSGMIEEFDAAYSEIAREIGVQLAPRDDPEKSFAKSKTGVVLGVRYDSERWTWGMPQEKLRKFAEQVNLMLTETECRQDQIQSVLGKIINVKALVPGGKFHIDHLMRLQNVSENGATLVKLNTEFKRQLHFWLTMLTACSDRAAIPAEETRLPPWAIECFTDAAGGSMESAGRGLGAVIPQWGWWCYMPWSRGVNDGALTLEGKKIGRKLSALELMGPLLVMASAASELRGTAIKFWVDNNGSVLIWKKGYSVQCRLASTIVKAIAGIAAALGSSVDIQKVTRCSSAGTIAADALSKADFRTFRGSHETDTFSVQPAKVPKQLLKWAVMPHEDDDLDKKILTEIAAREPVLGINC